jgi:nucleoside-diphosphate-sugar epimerase
MKKKVLITGASGFVGHGFLTKYQSQLELIPAKVRVGKLDQISLEGIDCVLHCAALVHQMQGAPESEYFQVNYELTKELADKALRQGVKHFVFISTAHVFGDSGSLTEHGSRLNEKSPCHPHDAYGRSKLKAEEYLLSLQKPEFCVSIVRPPMVYGKGAKGNILALAKLVRLSPALPLKYSDNRRSLVGIENLCQFISLVISKQVPGIFLPQDKAPISLAEMVNSLALAMHKKILLFPLPVFIMKLIFKFAPSISARLFGTLAMDSTASNLALGYQAELSTTEGFKRMLS